MAHCRTLWPAPAMSAITIEIADAGPSPADVIDPIIVLYAISIGVWSLPIQEFTVCMTVGSLKSWIVPMMDRRIASRAVLLTIGIFTCQVSCQPFAPSSRAAS